MKDFPYYFIQSLIIMATLAVIAMVTVPVIAVIICFWHFYLMKIILVSTAIAGVTFLIRVRVKRNT
jgi:hypothetical protein